MSLIAAMLLAQASVQLGSGPTPQSNPAFWVDLDYGFTTEADGLTLPEYEARDGFDVSIDLMLDERGNVADCNVVDSNAELAVDYQLCNSLRLNARFQPAHDEAGKPVPSVWNSTYRTIDAPIGDSRSTLAQPDLIVKVERLPSDLPYVLVPIREVVLPDRSVESCAVAVSSGDNTLDTAACSAALQNIHPQPVTDRHDKPVRGVRTYLVGFPPTMACQDRAGQGCGPSGHGAGPDLSLLAAWTRLNMVEKSPRDRRRCPTRVPALDSCVLLPAKSL